MDSGERGMNPFAMTNPRKEYWQSRGSSKQPPHGSQVCNATDRTMGLGFGCLCMTQNAFVDSADQVSGCIERAV